MSVKNWRIAWYGKNSHKLGGQKHSVGRVERVKEETEDFLLVDYQCAEELENRVFLLKRAISIFDDRSQGKRTTRLAPVTC